MRHFDVIVVGAGPAGIAAATAAAQSGCRVAVLDDNPSPGGQIWRAGRKAPNGRPSEGNHARREALRKLDGSGATVLSGYRVFDVPAPETLCAIRESASDATADAPENSPEILVLGYEKLVLATGARERFLPFPGWTLPGVVGPGGLQALVKGGFNVQGKRVAVAGSGPLLLAVAAHLKAYGAKLTSVSEQAPVAQLLPFAASLWSHPEKFAQGMKYRAAIGSAPFRTGCWPVSALPQKEAQGKALSVAGVRLTDGKKTWDEPCDLLACGFHMVPNTELAALLGCGICDDFVLVDERQQTSVANVYCAGEPAGIGGIEVALVQGEIAGLACAGKPTGSLDSRNLAGKRFAARMAAAFRLRPELRTLASTETIVCRCEDVTYGALAKRNGWTDAKLQTRCGMGPCQGRICGPATEVLFNWAPKSIRPPLTPVPVGALYSHDFQPTSSTNATALKENS
jgi:NADPH-dependent 2,4-dienoyl-CoA reductase/sulfur reductase-like enzyme